MLTNYFFLYLPTAKQTVHFSNDQKSTTVFTPKVWSKCENGMQGSIYIAQHFNLNRKSVCFAVYLLFSNTLKALHS